MATSTTATPRPEVGIPTSTGIFKLASGRVVRRTELSNDSTVETDVFADDYREVPGAKPNADGAVEMRPVETPAPIALPAQ